MVSYSQFLNAFLGEILIEKRNQRRLTEHPGKFFGFEHVMIYATDERTYYLSAASLDEMNKWMKSFRLAIAGIDEQVNTS